MVLLYWLGVSKMGVAYWPRPLLGQSASVGKGAPWESFVDCDFNKEAGVVPACLAWQLNEEVKFWLVFSVWKSNWEVLLRCLWWKEWRSFGRGRLGREGGRLRASCAIEFRFGLRFTWSCWLCGS